MPSVQPEASVAATGLGIRYISDYAYGYSGEITLTTSDTTMLLFTTGSGIILAKTQFFYLAQGGSGTDANFSVKFNDLEILQFEDDRDIREGLWPNPIPLVIPPQTKVELIGKVDASTEVAYATFTGRVYGAE